MAFPNETTTPGSDQWYYAEGSQVHGPLSSRQLADLAARGCVRRDYPVKRGDDGKWHLASQVKGLIFAPEPQTEASIAVVAASPPPLPARDEPTAHPIDSQDPTVDAAGSGAVVIRLTSADLIPDPALIATCPECGEQIKHAAKACPGCGCPLEAPVEAAAWPVQPAPASPRLAIPGTSRSPSPLDAATKQASAIVNDLRQMDLRGEIVPIDESNLIPLLKDGIFWFATLLGIVPLMIGTLTDTNAQVMVFALFFAAVWGVIFRSAIVKDDTSWKFLLAAMFFTGILGTIAAGHIEIWLLPPNFPATEGYITSLLKFIVVVGFSEELCKLVPPVAYLLWKRTAARPMTVVLIGVFSGLGFAAFENLTYSQMAILQTAAATDAGGIRGLAEGVQEAMVQAMLRPLSLVFCHAVWAGMFAYFLARASLSRRRWGALFIVGLCVSAFLHGTYDWFNYMQPSVSVVIAAASFMLFYAYVAKLRAAIAKPDKPEVVAEGVMPG